jgi:hypothetical protein
LFEVLTLDVRDFLLLLGVGLHLVDLVFGPGSDIGRVVTTIVDELLLEGDVNDVGADLVHEVGRVPRGQCDSDRGRQG